ncbi:MAG: hypothetical protein GY792_23630, partial [Gammaproteobacteria bacterium]|nr:hypothetical protein [Gammaproteobacteria bacterium]
PGEGVAGIPGGVCLAEGVKKGHGVLLRLQPQGGDQAHDDNSHRGAGQDVRPFGFQVSAQTGRGSDRARAGLGRNDENDNWGDVGNVRGGG